MKKVVVRGADGADHTLALVREEGRTVYVCPISKYQEAVRGCDDAVVGFPVTDVVEGLRADT